ncbi:zinc-dependent metalloprotease [Spiractinospora alimapuensis]|nr:zinc-dependent metalloprotease [Spiractinospora alimapuensis]
MPNDPDDESRRGSGDSGSGSGNSPGSSGGDFPFGDPQQMAQMLRQFADMMSQASTPAPGGGGDTTVNWDMAKNIARHTVAEGGKDPSVTAGEYAHVQEALRLADLWLDQATSLPSGLTSMEGWSRSEWVEKTMPSWTELCEPLTGRIVESMNANLPEEMRSMAGPLVGMLRQMGGMLVGQQAGQAIGELAKEVLGSTDVGIPLGGEGRGALIPMSVAQFGEGLGVSEEEVRLYLAAREAAHHRLFVHAPWLRAHVTSLIEEYARGVSFDMSGLEEKLGQVDLNDPQAMQEALAGGEGLFQPQETPQQKASLARLETAVALIEGWVSVVVDAAVEERLPQSAALAEAIRRRRATGGPAERTFATLVGLELRPRRLRDAAALWRAVTDARGIEGRDHLWEHPDLLPDAEALDDPDAFIRGRADADEFDLTELTGEADGDSTGAQDDGEDGADGGTEGRTS